MTQNPYAQIGGIGNDPNGGFISDGFGDDLRPTRTSALAVASLVFALLCLVPGPGALAVILGGAAMIVINTSRGRLKGLGLAISGTVIGLVTSIVWVLILVAVVQATQFFNREMIAPAANMMAQIEAKNPAGVKALLTGAPTVTDEQVTAFRDAYRPTLGTFRSSPDSLWGLIQAYSEVGQQMGQLGNSNKLNNVIPIPATFEKGTAMIFMEIDPSGGSRTKPVPGSTGVGPPVRNLGILVPGGTSITWLLDTGNGSAASPPTSPLPLPGAATPAPAAPSPPPPPPPPAGG